MVSHPFARKKAKGWGTATVVDQRAVFISGVNLLWQVRLLLMDKKTGRVKPAS
jgi:hypothetical protein